MRWLAKPSVVGSVLGGVLSGLVVVLWPTDGKVLEVVLEGPFVIASSAEWKGLHVAIGGKPTRSLFAYRIRLWNSGTDGIDSTKIQIHVRPVDTPVAVVKDTALFRETARTRFDSVGIIRVDSLQSMHLRQYTCVLLNGSGKGEKSTPGEALVLLWLDSLAEVEVVAWTNGQAVDDKIDSASARRHLAWHLQEREIRLF